MRKPAWRRFLAANGAFLALAALGAVPVRAAESTAPPTTDRAWLGVYTQPLSSELRESMTYKGTGVLVNRVVDGSPADKAGLKDGDIITSCNSRSIDSPDALSNLIAQAKVGQSIALKIVRDGKTQTVNAKLAARPSEDESGEDDHGSYGMRHFEFDMPDVEMMPGMVRMMGHGRLGVRIESLNPDLGGYFSVPDGKGVLVTEVLKSTAAEKAGLKAGDVITKVGDKTVADSDDLMRALGDSEGKVTLAIVRKGQKKTVEADLGESPRVMTMRHGGDVEHLRANPDQQRQIDELKRQIDELKRQIDSMKH
jgi:S1-C subfamily serine protease